MTSLRPLAAAAAMLSLGLVANAAAAGTPHGHYEWRAAPQAGPRGPLQAPRRVWVADADRHLAQAACECPMMRKAPVACMMSRKAG